MKLNDFKKNLTQTHSEKKYLIILLAFALVAIVILSVQATTQSERIVIAPYTLSEEGWVSRDNASVEYKEAMGLFFAELLGNVSPNNIDFIRERIDPILSSRIRQDVMSTLADQAETIRNEQVSISFSPRSLLYEQETGKVFVSGATKTEGPSGGSTTEQRTYEFKFEVSRYTPQLTRIDNYPGRAKTLEVKRMQSQGNR